MLGTDLRTDPRFNGIIFRLVGAADYESVAALDAGITRVLAAHPAQVIVDASGLEFLNSGAIGRLVELRKRVMATGGQVAIAGATRYVAECFRLSRLDHAFTMHATVDAAINTLAG